MKKWMTPELPTILSSSFTSDNGVETFLARTVVNPRAAAGNGHDLEAESAFRWWTKLPGTIKPAARSTISSGRRLSPDRFGADGETGR